MSKDLGADPALALRAEPASRLVASRGDRGESNPYFIEGPALISFSGGRTSGYMLKQIIDAHGGTLPGDVHVCFANTGKEREETLRFVHECETRWGVRVHWLEWAGEKKFVERDFATASRKGEPFAALIKAKHALPNSFMRFCTEDLKLETIKAFLRSTGLGVVTNPVGLRRDEGKRVARQMLRNTLPNQPWNVVCPLYDAGVTREAVMEFWADQDFDLGLHPWEGNCDRCFLKGKAIQMRLERDRPQDGDWWIEQEQASPYMFRKGRESYQQIRGLVAASPMLPRIADMDEEHDVECGLWCDRDAA